MQHQPSTSPNSNSSSPDVLPNCKQAEGQKTQRLQGRALREIYSCRTDTYYDLLRRPNLSSLYNGRLPEKAILMYEVRNGRLRYTSLLKSKIWKTLY